MKQVIESAASGPYANINYPGAPVDDPPAVAARTTSRATVDYDTYVLRYAARQRGHVLLATAGVGLIFFAALYLGGVALSVLVALGIGAIMAGGVGFVIAADAHGSYTRHLAVSVSETYHSRPDAPPPATVRPFVASRNNDGRTTNTGRLKFTPDVWRALFDRALENGGAITRDGAQSARVGREWYHGAGWGGLQEELSRLGFIDGRNRLTPAALQWYEAQIALPLSSIPLRSRPERTNGANERTNGAILGEWEE